MTEKRLIVLAFAIQLIAKHAKIDFGRQVMTISREEYGNVIFLSGDFPVRLEKIVMDCEVSSLK